MTSGRLIIDHARDYLPLFQIDRVFGPYAQGLGARTVRLYFDLEVEIAGAVYTVAAGRLVVEPDVTATARRFNCRI